MPDRKYDTSEICKLINQNSSIDKDGNFTTPGFLSISTAELALTAMSETNRDIPADVKSGLIHTAIVHARKKGEVTPSSLQAAIRFQEQKYLKRPIEKYYLLTHLSVDRNVSAHLSWTRVNGSTISFPEQISRKNQEWIDHCFEQNARSFAGQIFPSGYLIVRVSTVGRSLLEAGNRALRNLDLLRATWNIAINQRRRMTLAGGVRKPVNEVLLGPTQTLFRADSGEPASRQWWYTPEFSSWDTSTRFERHLQRALQAKSDLLGGAKRYGNEVLNDLLIRYVRALDLPDWENSILKLWSVLETGTIGDQYVDGKRIITRAAGLYTDSGYVKQLLESIRMLRNDHVHSGVEITESEVAMYELKSTVEDLLRFHLRSKFKFQTFEEACRFLELPTTATLNRRMELYNYAKRFRGDV